MAVAVASPAEREDAARTASEMKGIAGLAGCGGALVVGRKTAGDGVDNAMLTDTTAGAAAQPPLQLTTTNAVSSGRPPMRCRTCNSACTDPFCRLDDLCILAISDYLSMRDLIRCSGVNCNWRHRLAVVVTDQRIRSYFPFFKSPPATAWGQRVQDLRRLAWREAYLSNGIPTWRYRFTGAAHYSIAGNYAAWCKFRTNEIYWLELRKTDAQELRLPRIGEFPLSGVEDMLVGEGGVVFIRGIVERVSRKVYSDQMYRLSDGKLLWCKDSSDPKTAKPLFIGRTRAYFLSPALPTSTKSFLSAVCTYSGQTIYKRKISHKMHKGEFEDFYRDVYRLLSLQGRDYIINNSHRREDFFTIIDGETGAKIQRIKQDGLNGYYAMAIPNTTAREFVLWSKACPIREYCRGDSSEPARRVVQQTFAQMPDGTFACTNVRTILQSRGAYFVVHPHGDYGFSLGIEGLRVLSIAPDTTNKRQSPPLEPNMGQQYRVNKVKMVAAKDIIVRWWEQNRPPVVLGESRIAIDEAVTEERTVNIFEFGPAW